MADPTDIEDEQGGAGKKPLRLVPNKGVHPDHVFGLTYDDKGAAHKTVANVCRVLRGTRKLWFDEMALQACDGDLQFDNDLVTAWREKLFPLYQLNPAKEMIVDSAQYVAQENKMHPVRTYLNSLVWDQKPYIGRIARLVLNMKDPLEIEETMLRKWLISCVARVMTPGCKVDTVFVLYSAEQGQNKSEFFRTLAGGDWFSDTQMDIKNKDSALQLYRAWIYEWGEIDRVTSGWSSAEIKSWMSSRQDTIRRPYAESVEIIKRHSVVVGSTNKLGFLTDETGDRRYWILAILCALNLRLAAEWRDQIWAEAVSLWREAWARQCAGEDSYAWWLTPTEESARIVLQERFAAIDPNADAIEEWYAAKMPGYRATLREIMANALKLEPKDYDRGKHGAVRALRRLGYHPVRNGNARERVWIHESEVRPGHEVSPA